MVTRAATAASALVDPLRARGARVLELPAIDIAAPSDGGAAAREAFGDLDAYDWLVVTSPNGAASIAALGFDVGRCAIAAIGPKTAAACTDAGWSVDLVPDSFVAEGLVAAFPEATDAGRVLLARAEVARDVLPIELAAKGWTVDDVAVYRSVTPAVDDATVAAARDADVVTFASASTVDRYLDVVGVAEPAAAVCIGPITGERARARGFAATDAAVHTIDGLVDAVVDRWSR